MRCPRCHLETGDPAPALCPRCAAPLRLGEEGPPRRLDLPIAMDRRAGERRPIDDGEGPAPAAADGVGEQRPAQRSHWDLGAVVAAARAEPLGLPLQAAAVAADEPAALWSPAPEEAALASPEPEAPDAVGPFDVDVDALEIRLRRPAAWRRVAAGLVDAVPFAAAGFALARSLLGEAGSELPAPATGLDGLLDLVTRDLPIILSVAATVALALAVYAALAHALAGATLGKRLLGLRLVGPDGRRPSLGRSAWRAALAVVSGALLGLGFHLALFTRSGRALHDLAARTWVVEAP